MKSSTTTIRWIGLLALAVPAAAQAQECAKNLVAGDRDVWAAYPFMTQIGYRDAEASYYNWRKDNWDESWGWAKYNDTNPDRFGFTKMMSATRVLYGGIKSDLALQGAWIAQASVLLTQPLMVGLNFVAVSRAPDYIDILYKDANGGLRNRELHGTPWNAGTFADATTSYAVSDNLADAKNDYRFDGPIAATGNTCNGLSVFARSGNKLLHFRKQNLAGWSVEDLTALVARPTPMFGSDRYFISGTPVVLHTSVSVDVYAVDNFNHLIRYYRTSCGGWSAEDITELTGGTRILSAPDVAFGASGDGREVFGLNSSGELIHFWRDNVTPWQAENISRAIGSNSLLVGTPSLVRAGAGAWFVFGRAADRLLSFQKLTSGQWQEVDHTPAVGGIEGDPVAVRGEGPAAHTFDVFARGLTDNLINLRWNGLTIEYHDVTRELAVYAPYYGIAGPPIAEASWSRSAGNRLDVFAPARLAGHVFHYFWTPQYGWNVEDIHSSADVSTTYERVQGELIAVRRGESAIHVFAAGDMSPFRIIHMSAATGLVLNPWHRGWRYASWAAGSNHDFKWVPSNEDEDAVMTAFRSSFWWDQVYVKCPAFEDTPAERAASMLHEATHMNHWRWKHQANVVANGCDDPCSDNWYYHGLGDPAGEIPSSGKNHSMTQIEIEFLCDIAEFPITGFPASAYIGAKLTANSLMEARIRNPPGWRCGNSRPLWW